MNKNDVPTHVSASGERGALAEGSSAEVSLKQGVWERGLAGRMGRRKGRCLAEEMQKQKKPKSKNLQETTKCRNSQNLSTRVVEN